jgi:hypothetical protein
MEMDRNERQQSIAVAAYFRAEKHGFSGNSELDDWLEAEREYDGLLTPFPDAMPNEGPPEKDPESSKEPEAPVVPPSS